MGDQKYKVGDKYWEVSFQVPMVDRWDHEEKKDIIDRVFKAHPEAVNVIALACDIYIDPPRLAVSKQSSSYTIHNTKQESQIIEDDDLSRLRKQAKDQESEN